MGEAIIHRGPDDGGLLVDDIAGFAFRRLSIIDVAGGPQPIFNEDDSAGVLLNGEIYNHHDLRKGPGDCGDRFRPRSGGETVLPLWGGERGQSLTRLRGTVALA